MPFVHSVREAARRMWRNSDADLRAFVAGYLLLLPFFLAPVVSTKYLPGLDLPFHLSTADLLSKGVAEGSPYAGYYTIKGLWAPYSAHYLALVAIAKIVGSIALAHNVVMVVYVASLPLTLAAWLGTCGRSRIPALLAFPLAYNLCLHYGFVSFCLSMPVMLALFAALCHHLQQPRFTWTTWVACAGSGVLLFLSHLQNLLFGLCGAAVILVFCRAGLRRRLTAFASLAPTFASLLYWHLTSSFAGDVGGQKKTLAFAWQSLKAARLIDLAGGRRSVREDILDRLSLIPASALKGFVDLSDVAGCKALFWVLAAYAFIGVIGFALPRPSNDHRPRLRMAAWLIAFGAAVAYFALPHHLWAFELMTFFPRFAVLLVLLLIPLVPAGMRRLPWQGAVMALAPALVVGVLYGNLVHTKYKAYRDEINDFVTVLNRIPRDGKLMGIVFDRTSKVMRIESAVVGLPGFYVATKPDARTMVPVHYCGMRHMPCGKTREVPWPGPWNSVGFSWDEAYALFDYYIMRHTNPVPALLGPVAPNVALVHRSGQWAAYARRPPQPTRPSAVP